MPPETDPDEDTQPNPTVPWIDLPLVPTGWPANIPPAPHTITRWAHLETQRIRRRRQLRRAAVGFATAGIAVVGYILYASLVSWVLAAALVWAAV
jgi:hypothetical protein